MAINPYGTGQSFQLGNFTGCNQPGHLFVGRIGFPGGVGILIAEGVEAGRRFITVITSGGLGGK